MRPLWAACILITTAWTAGCDAGAAPDFGGFMEGLLPREPGEVARDAFNVYDPDRRRSAINTLASAPWGGEPPYLQAYRLLIDDPDPTVRAACLRALGRHGHPDDVATIARYLNDDISFVRWEAAMALERLHHPDSVAPLMQALRDDEDADVRLAAARALGQYAEQRVFEALIGSLTDTNYSVVRQAVRSLNHLTGEDLGDRGSQWLAWQGQQDDPFAQQQPYYYTKFIRPPGFLDHLQFWRRYPTAEPTQPLGLEGTQRVEVDPDEPYDADVHDELPLDADDIPDAAP